MGKKSFLTIIMLLLIALLVAVVACGKKSEQEKTTDNDAQKPAKILKLGNATPLSGPAAMWGVAISNDMDIYAELINEDGGLKVGDETYMLEMYYADDEALPDKAAVSAQDLIENKGVKAILGYWSNGTHIIAQAANPHKVILVSTKPDKYVPATMPYTAFSANDTGMTVPQLSSLLKFWPDTKVIGIATDNITTASLETVMPEVKEFLDEKGVKYAYEIYPWDTNDFVPQLEKFKQAKVDAVYFYGAIGSQAMMNKQIHVGGYNMKLAGAGALVNPKEYVETAGYEAAQGIIQAYTPPWDLKENKVSEDMKKMALRIVDRHKIKYNDPDFAGDSVFNYGGNSMALYIEAIQQAGTIDADAVMKVIDGGTFNLFTGTQTLGGLKTYGRAVVGSIPGSMGVIEGYTPRLVAESPRFFE